MGLAYLTLAPALVLNLPLDRNPNPNIGPLILCKSATMGDDVMKMSIKEMKALITSAGLTLTLNPNPNPHPETLNTTLNSHHPNLNLNLNPNQDFRLPTATRNLIFRFSCTLLSCLLSCLVLSRLVLSCLVLSSLV